MDTYSSPASRARQHEHTPSDRPKFKWTSSRFVRISGAICMLPIFMNGLSGDWLWPQAWFVALAQITIFFAAARYVWLHNPGLYTEREQFTGHEDTAAFDKVLATAVVYVTPFLYFASGLQHRYTQPWDHSITTSQAVAAVVDVLSLMLQCWAMITNHSSVVRIQRDRGHKVCQAGPYSYVRHPGYIGAVLQPLSESVLLGSSWCLVVGMLRTLILAVRTVLEDALLHKELSGYADYAKKVRYKWVPFVW